MENDSTLPRTYQQTNCPKCNHRFSVEVLGLPPPQARTPPKKFKLEAKCGLCNKPMHENGEECSIKLSPLQSALISVALSVNFCDHYCCGDTDWVCKVKTLAHDLLDPNQDAREELRKALAESAPEEREKINMITTVDNNEKDLKLTIQVSYDGLRWDAMVIEPRIEGAPVVVVNRGTDFEAIQLLLADPNISNYVMQQMLKVNAERNKGK